MWSCDARVWTCNFTGVAGACLESCACMAMAVLAVADIRMTVIRACGESNRSYTLNTGELYKRKRKPIPRRTRAAPNRNPQSQIQMRGNYSRAGILYSDCTRGDSSPSTRRLPPPPKRTRRRKGASPRRGAVAARRSALAAAATPQARTPPPPKPPPTDAQRLTAQPHPAVPSAHLAAVHASGPALPARVPAIAHRPETNIHPWGRKCRPPQG